MMSVISMKIKKAETPAVITTKKVQANNKLIHPIAI